MSLSTHPQEKRIIMNFFQFKIIYYPFPLEILKCLCFNVNKVITVSSTPVDEIELYDRKTSPEELNKMMGYLNNKLN